LDTVSELRISSAALVARARARIEEIETAELINAADDPALVVVDIRDIRERQREGFIRAVSTRLAA